jgi:cobalt-zinc-cadmium efflux system outer membrane protein
MLQLHLKRNISFSALGLVLGLLTVTDSTTALAANTQAPHSVSVEHHYDVAIETLLRLAVKNAPETVVGQASVESSRSSLVGARLLPLQNPYVEVVADHNNHTSSSKLGVVGTLWLPFELSGQRGKRIDEANAWIDYHVATLQTVHATAKAMALVAWGRAIVENERIRLLTEIVASAQSETDVFRTRREAGDATERDAQLAEVEHARLIIELEQALVARDAAFGELLRLTGQPLTIPDNAKILPQTNLERLAVKIPQARPPSVQASRSEANYQRTVAERADREAVSPLSLILMGGRGDLGEAKIGAGLAWTFPMFRRNQGERARAQAEQDRLLVQASVMNKDVAARLTRITNEWHGTRRALSLLKTQALPAAQRARESTEAMFKAGKVDLLAVMVSRRDEALLRLRHLDLAEHEWELLASWTMLTGDLP